MNKDIEALLVTNNKITIMNIYRPPKGDINEFTKTIKDVLMPLTRDKKDILLAGDFNIDFLSSSRAKQLITDTCLDLNLLLPHQI